MAAWLTCDWGEGLSSLWLSSIHPELISPAEWDPQSYCRFSPPKNDVLAADSGNGWKKIIYIRQALLLPVNEYLGVLDHRSPFNAVAAFSWGLDNPTAPGSEPSVRQPP